MDVEVEDVLPPARPLALKTLMASAPVARRIPGAMRFATWRQWAARSSGISNSVG